jgi:hypothetical protein
LSLPHAVGVYVLALYASSLSDDTGNPAFDPPKGGGGKVICELVLSLNYGSNWYAVFRKIIGACDTSRNPATLLQEL